MSDDSVLAVAAKGVLGYVAEKKNPVGEVVSDTLLALFGEKIKEVKLSTEPLSALYSTTFVTDRKIHDFGKSIVASEVYKSYTDEAKIIGAILVRNHKEYYKDFTIEDVENIYMHNGIEEYSQK